MSKAQVDYEYQKLLWERSDRILQDRPRTFIGRWLQKGVASYYPMPLMPLDDDYRQVAKNKYRAIDITGELQHEFVAGDMDDARLYAGTHLPKIPGFWYISLIASNVGSEVKKPGEHQSVSKASQNQPRKDGQDE